LRLDQDISDQISAIRKRLLWAVKTFYNEMGAGGGKRRKKRLTQRTPSSQSAQRREKQDKEKRGWGV
jgi:hypothetical protein